MKKIILLSLFSLLVSFQVEAFVLLDPLFQLKNPNKTKIKVSSEGCIANGISDFAVGEAIKEAVEFWNDVPESKLKLSYGGKSSGSIASATVPANEIIIGCGNLPSLQILGATQSDYVNHSARVTMNNAVYTGSYSESSFIGTIIHEVGHGLGLFHSSDPASVMTYSPHGWTDRPKYISQDDVEGIVYLYPNDKAVGGFLGSCTSFAGDGKANPNFILDALLGILFIFTAMKAVKMFRIKFR